MRIDPIGRSELPVSIEIARAHLRVEHGVDAMEDSLVEFYLRGAVADAQKATRRVIGQQRFRLVVEPTSIVTLPVYPVASVDSITVDGVEVPPEAWDLRADLLPQEIRAVGEWPAGEIVIEITAGHTHDTMPDDLADLAGAILLGLGHRYENREAIITGTIATPTPLAYDRICWANRVGL